MRLVTMVTMLLSGINKIGQEGMQGEVGRPVSRLSTLFYGWGLLPFLVGFAFFYGLCVLLFSVGFVFWGCRVWFFSWWCSLFLCVVVFASFLRRVRFF